MNNLINQLFGLAEIDYVSWEQLSSLPCGIWFNKKGEEVIDDNWKIKYRQIQTKIPNQLLYETEIKPLEQYDNHYHNCKETITPLNGVVECNGVIVKECEQFTFHKGTKHIVLNPSASVIRRIFVEFNK